MGQNQINIALLGLGRIGQMHALNLTNHPEFNLKYTFDIDKNLNKKLGKKHKSIPINNPKIAFDDSSIKCIFIATSTKTHLNYIDKAVRNKKVVSIEGKDGTEKMLKQCKSRKFRNRGVLVKFPKKKQDLRVDLPTVGLKTLEQCKLAGLKGIVVKNKQNIFLERKKCISFANKNKMFILSK